MPAGKGCLGILTNERDGSPPFEGARFHRLLAEAGMRRGLFVYVFTPRGVDWIGKRVTGFVYDRATGRWEVRNLPLPDLVYDRFFILRAAPPRGSAVWPAGCARPAAPGFSGSGCRTIPGVPAAGR